MGELVTEFESYQVDKNVSTIDTALKVDCLEKQLAILQEESTLKTKELEDKDSLIREIQKDNDDMEQEIASLQGR